VTGKKKGRIGFMKNAGMKAVWPGSGIPPGGSLLAARRWRGQTQLGVVLQLVSWKGERKFW